MQYNSARDGWTVKMLADLLASYAKHDPDAIVRFTSNESGGYWPTQRNRPMGVFTDHQCAVHDETLCGGTVTFGISLMVFDREK